MGLGILSHPLVENQMEKKMESDMEIAIGLYKDYMSFCLSSLKGV